MAAKRASSSCFTFLKEALLLPTRNPKLFIPVFLILFVTSLVTALINVLCIQPLTADIGRLAVEMKNTDPSSAEYARIFEELRRDTMEVVAASAVLLLVALPVAFAKQIIAFFAASTTFSGDRYSLAELLRALATKGGALSIKGPSITIAVATLLEISGMAILAALFSATMMIGRNSSRSGVISAIHGLLFVLAFIAFLYLNVVALVGVAASVADGGGDCRGVRALRRAWRLMRTVRRKEGFVLVLAACLLPTTASPLNGLAMVYVKKNMAMGLCLLSVYVLLSCAFQLFSMAAATVYYYRAMESKEETLAAGDYVKIPSGETNV